MNKVFNLRSRAAILGRGLDLAAAASPAAACAATEHAGAGSLISYHRVAVLSRRAVAIELRDARIAPGAPALGARAVRSGVGAYRVVYRTRGPSGGMVPASGLVAFPTGATARMAMVDYGHGTTASREDVPSSFGMDGGLGIEGRWSAELFASAGFAVALPDYLGLGVSHLRPQY
jgi:hypothetical protein